MRLVRIQNPLQQDRATTELHQIILLFSVEELEATYHVRLHNIAVLFAQMFCFRFSFVIVLVLVFLS